MFRFPYLWCAQLLTDVQLTNTNVFLYYVFDVNKLCLLHTLCFNIQVLYDCYLLMLCGFLMCVPMCVKKIYREKKRI